MQVKQLKPSQTIVRAVLGAGSQGVHSCTESLHYGQMSQGGGCSRGPGGQPDGHAESQGLQGWAGIRQVNWQTAVY